MTKEENGALLLVACGARRASSDMVVKLMAERAALLESARAMVAANDAPIHAETQSDERAQAWLKLRAALQLAES